MRMIEFDFADKALSQNFLIGLNTAFQSRSSGRIPYRPIDESEIDTAHKMIALQSDDKIVGGLCITFLNEKRRIATIGHVFTLPEYRGMGIARNLMLKAEEIAIKQGCGICRLSVANIYETAVNLYSKLGYKPVAIYANEPAVNLYSKLGYKPVAIYANEPGTYYFIRMEKEIGKKYSEAKRLLTLIISKFKFNLLFKPDSTPKLLHRIIYGTRNID